MDLPPGEPLAHVRRSTLGPPDSVIERELSPHEVTVWWHEVDRPSLILGSHQGAILDADMARRRGWTVTRRRSGGGLVVATQTNGLWLDVGLPRRHPLWDDDVHRAFDWLGRAWARALDAVASTLLPHRGSPHRLTVHDLTVHDDAQGRRDGGSMVCFAGVGAGEVLVDGRKVVGLSQRRSRDLARFQCQFLLVDPRLDAAIPTTLEDCFGDELCAVWRAMPPIGWSTEPSGDSTPALGLVRSAVDAELSRILTVNSN